MNNNIHTLTAYKISFDYIRRNNPLKESLSESISAGESPSISIGEVLHLLIEKTSANDFELLSNNGKVILLNDILAENCFGESGKRLRIEPYAGKRDIPTRMVNLSDKEKKVYDFGREWSSTYRHYVFIYIIADQCYAVFHRKGGSGCKTIFNAAINQLLRSSGIKMEMAWIPPADSNLEDAMCSYEKVTFLYEEGKTSDEADDLHRKTKKVIVKELTLNLRNERFPSVSRLLKRYQLKEIGKTDALTSLVREAGAFSECNNAKITVKLGKSRRIIEWDDFENLISGYDITDKVSGYGEAFVSSLTACSDEFILSLVGKEV